MIEMFRRKPEFVPRSADRDRETDLARLGKIRRTLAEIAGEIDREWSGLQTRHESAQTGAAILLLRLESEGLETGANPHLDRMSDAMLYCERRRSELAEQRRFMRELDEAVASESGRRRGG